MRGYHLKSNCSSKLDSAVRNYINSSDNKNLKEIIELGSPLVYHFARVYSGGNPTPDLIQVGYEGLLKAVRRFDPLKGVNFSTYGGHCIIGEIRHYIRKEKSFYRPGCITRLQVQVDKFIEEYFKENGNIPNTKTIAASLNIKQEGVAQVMRAGLVPIEEVDIKKICSERYESFRLPIEDRIVLQQALHKLTVLQRKVIYLLFYRDFTQQQAADQLGINQRKVSRILHAGLRHLKKLLVENKCDIN